jgi:hypothetical protein
MIVMKAAIENVTQRHKEHKDTKNTGNRKKSNDI